MAQDVRLDRLILEQLGYGAVVGAGWASGKFLYVDTDLKIDKPEADAAAALATERGPQRGVC